jgi:hypothetical protein
VASRRPPRGTRTPGARSGAETDLLLAEVPAREQRGEQGEQRGRQQRLGARVVHEQGEDEHRREGESGQEATVAGTHRTARMVHDGAIGNRHLVPTRPRRIAVDQPLG